MSDPIARAAAAVTDRRVAVALSGGIDSVVLVHALRRSGVDVCAVHVDHDLRVDSGEDAHFCRQLCSNLAIQFRCVALEVAPGNSTQGRARIQRYAALVRAAAELGADAIATGHHADDALESSFLQAWRGAGVVGRAGPRPRTDWHGFTIIRPLLGVPRAAIEEYAAVHRLDWREDPTNEKTDYLRNYVRHEVLPQIDVDAARALLPRLRREATEFEESVREEIAQRVVESGPTRRTLMRATPSSARSPRRVLAGMLLTLATELGGRLSGELVGEIVDAIGDSETETRRFCGRRIVVEVSGELVVLEATRGQGTRLLDSRKTPVVELRAPIELPWFGRMLVVEANGTTAVDSIVVRGPRSGERIGSRLIHDVLAGHDVPPSARWCWPCLFVGDDCVRVCGLDGTEEGREILLPDGRFSGIFVSSYRLSDTDACEDSGDKLAGSGSGMFTL